MTTAATMGTIVIGSHDEQDSKRIRIVKKNVYDFVSDDDGQVLATIDGLEGMIHRVVFVPDSGGTQPTDNSDWKLKDSDGIDALNSGGANRSNSLATSVAAYQSGTNSDFAFPNLGTMTVTGSACGAANGMTLRIFHE